MGIVLDMTRYAFERADADDVEGFLETQAPGCTWSTPEGELDGHDDIRAYVEGFRDGFPGGRHDIDRAYEPAEDTVVIEGRWTGTHTGTLRTPAGDVPPTGRTVVSRFALVVTADVAARQATRIALYNDRLAMMEQLGLLPAPQATGAAS